MSFEAFPSLISGPSYITKSKEPRPSQKDNPIFTGLSKPFPVAQLPHELRQLIYTYYFSTIPPVAIRKDNAAIPLHQQTPLALASPYLAVDPALKLFHNHAVFSFACASHLQPFSERFDRKRDVRKVRVAYGRCDAPTRDWVFLLMSSFERLEEITFLVGRESVVAGDPGADHRCFGNWWGCVRDAVREGWCSSNSRRAPILRVEVGTWSVEETIGG